MKTTIDKSFSSFFSSQAKFVLPILLGILAVAPEVFAGTSGLGGAQGRVQGFFDNINAILTAVSVTVVTIAFVFAGYQIAFNHKRIADVSPVLIGGLVVGGAAQFARMLIG